MPGMESVFGAALVVAFAVVFVSFLGVVTDRASGTAASRRDRRARHGDRRRGDRVRRQRRGRVRRPRDRRRSQPPASPRRPWPRAACSPSAAGSPGMRDADRLIEAGRRNVDAVVAEHERLRAAELENQLARERANAAHTLTQQERKLAAERRDQIARQADRARAELAKSIEQVQERLEQRLTAWAADLDRGQRALETRLTALAQRQAEAIKAYEARLAADSDYLRTATEEQQAALGRLRVELQDVGRQLLQEGQSDLDLHADERRRALAELSARVRDQEKELREYVEREEADSLTRIQAAFHGRRAAAARQPRALARPSVVPPGGGRRAAVRRADPPVAREVRAAALERARQGDGAVRTPSGEGDLRPDRRGRAADGGAPREAGLRHHAHAPRGSTRSRPSGCAG